jgi:ferredoxin-thioredoxin reductase catalytic subunit
METNEVKKRLDILIQQNPLDWDLKLPAFIQSLLNQQKSELLQKITLEKEGCHLCSRPLLEHSEENGIYFCPCNRWHDHKENTSSVPCLNIVGSDKDVGYNQAVSDLEVLKATFETPIEGKDENPAEPED